MTNVSRIADARAKRAPVDRFPFTDAAMAKLKPRRTDDGKPAPYDVTDTAPGSALRARVNQSGIEFFVRKKVAGQTRDRWNIGPWAAKSDAGSFTVAQARKAASNVARDLDRPDEAKGGLIQTKAERESRAVNSQTWRVILANYFAGRGDGGDNLRDRSVSTYMDTTRLFFGYGNAAKGEAFLDTVCGELTPAKFWDMRQKRLAVSKQGTETAVRNILNAARLAGLKEFRADIVDRMEALPKGRNKRRPKEARADMETGPRLVAWLNAKHEEALKPGASHKIKIQGARAGACLLGFLAGLRDRTARELEWSDVNFKTATFNIPAHKNKWATDSELPVSPVMLEILKRRRKAFPNDSHVFADPRTGGELRYSAWLSVIMPAERSGAIGSHDGRKVFGATIGKVNGGAFHKLMHKTAAEAADVAGVLNTTAADAPYLLQTLKDVRPVAATVEGLIAAKIGNTRIVAELEKLSAARRVHANAKKLAAKHARRRVKK